MGTALVRNDLNQNSFCKIVDRTIEDTFSLKLDTKGKKIAAATAFIAFYALVPFVIYFGVGGYVAGSSVLAFEFVTSEMGLALVVGSSLVSIALLIVNVSSVLKPNTSQGRSQNTTFHRPRAQAAALMVISQTLPSERKSEVRSEKKTLETLEELERYCQKQNWDHNVLVNYMIAGNVPSSRQERLSEILTKALRREKLTTFNKFIKYLENINDPCIWVDERTKENLLCYFTRKKDLSKIRKLLEYYKADPKQFYKEGVSLLSFACSKAEESNSKKIDLEIVRLFLDFGADLNGLSHLSEGETLLEHFAKDPKRLILAKLFLEKEVDLSLKACINAVQWAPITLMHFFETFDLVEAYGVQIFHEAQKSQNRAIALRYLFNKGFSLQSIKEDVLLSEINNGNIRWIKYFVGKGAQINSTHLEIAKNKSDSIHKYLQGQFRRQKALGKVYAYSRVQLPSERKFRSKKSYMSKNDTSRNHLPR